MGLWSSSYSVSCCRRSGGSSASMSDEPRSARCVPAALPLQRYPRGVTPMALPDDIDVTLRHDWRFAAAGQRKAHTITARLEAREIHSHAATRDGVGNGGHLTP